ncbi:MAG: extracellular solute-binding protein [Spirochaetaceae bacterium]|nr:MAG: extracellular solute-binding protein [Spirochaetaceae bacterium]
MKIIILTLATLFLAGCNVAVDSPDANGPVTVDLFRWDLNVSGSDDISRLIESEFGLQFDIESPAWDEWPDRLSIRAAAGTLPEVFVGYGPMAGATYQQWISEGLLLELNDFVVDYPHLSSYLERYSHQQVNGSWYSIPVEDVTDHALILRQDWLDELGLAVPETLEELRSVAEAMRDRYGVTPLTSSAPHTAGFFWLNAFFYAHGSRWSDWVWSDSGNQWIPSWIADGSRHALETLRAFYREGLLDPDFLTNSDARKRELFASGEAGILFHNEVDVYISEVTQRDPDARVAIAPPPAGPGGRGMWGLDGYFSAVMIRSDIAPEKRDAVLAFLDFLHSDEGEELFHIGIEGTHFLRTADGIQPSGEPLLEAAPHAQLRTLRALEWKWVLPWHPHNAEMARSVEIGRRYGVPPRFENIVTDAAADYEAQLLDLVYARYPHMVTSDRPLDTLWDEFVEQYLESGGRVLIEEMNAHPRVTGPEERTDG